MRAVIISLLALSLLGACTERAKRITFDGNYYPTKERGTDKQDRKAFQVSVRRVDQGIDGAREAGRHGGSKYCIKNFGTSEIEWATGPDDPLETLQIANGNLLLTGRCVTW